MLSRRTFLGSTGRAASAAAGLAACPALAWAGRFAGPGQDLLSTAPKARYWTTAALAGADCGACHTNRPPAAKAHAHAPTTVRCLLCAQNCDIRAGQSGRCRARANVNGELRSLVYGRPASVHLDPIEKKPFYHFLPGSSALSFGTSGCPLRCRFCQNWELSQSTPGDLEAPFTSAWDMAGQAAARRAPVIAFTYNEPTVFVEYLLDVAAAAATRGIRSVMVSCGFANEAPLGDICRALSAVKIDLKGYSDDVLPPGLRRRASAGAAKHQAGREERPAPRNRQPRRADAERLREVAAGPGRLGGRRTGPGRAGPLHPVPPRLPAA